LLQKYSYYLTSIIKLLLYIRPLSAVLGVFLRTPRFGYQEISLPGQAVSFKVRGKMDIWSIKETFLDRFYERFGVPLGAGWTILDVGGGIGDFTIFAARAHASNTVYAFEPTPQSFALLQENLKRNHVKNAYAHPQAIWSSESTLWMDTNAGEPGQYTSLAGSAGSAMAGAVVVRSISLEQALQKIGAGHCDLLKMDCEGAEYAILFNTPAEILNRIQRIVMEYHDNAGQHAGLSENGKPNTHQDLARFLQSQGFTVKVTPNFVHDYLGYLYAFRA
jgi:FkbM family methyltransferase